MRQSEISARVRPAQAKGNVRSLVACIWTTAKPITAQHKAMTSPSNCWRHVTTLVTKLDVPSAGPGESTEPSAHLGITLKISKKVMPKHHQCHVVCWPMTRRKRGRRRIPSSWRNVVMHFRTKRSASSRPYMAIASGARGYADQAKSEAHWHGIVRSTFHVAVGCSVLKQRIRPIDSPRSG